MPDGAVGTDQNEHFLLVVDSDGTVKSAKVQLGRIFGNMRVIEDGVKASDRVIINGLQMAVPGTKVNVTEAPVEPAVTGTGITSGAPEATSGTSATTGSAASTGSGS